MTQGNLFPPATRKSDPQSSWWAEKEMNKSGTRGRQMGIVLETVRNHPGCTSLELTRYCNLDRYQIARRLADLFDAGLVVKGVERRCSIGSRKAVIWYKNAQKST